ncbi:MAG: type I glyceraldehyde-3-phosphate dehydrogenase [Patescibacteria group bacterium]
MNIAINGFGRIGRAVFKSLLRETGTHTQAKAGPRPLKIVAINDLTDIKTLEHLLKYDTVYGKYNKNVSSKEGSLIINGKKFKVLAEKDPLNLPWREMGVDLVLECTGRFRTSEDARKHIKAGAKKVIISAPAKSDSIKTIILGVNEEKIKKNDKVLSMASCTTNCLAPVSDIIKNNFGIKKAIMTTIHSYTSTQNLIDGPHKDLRRARAAAMNIVPTTTGAAIATTKAIPQLKDKFDGMAIRVPTVNGSICDIVYITNKKVNEKDVNKALRKASFSAKYKNILEVTDEPLVSSDFIGNPASAIVDLSLTKVIGGDLVKVIAWYDNEWGYSTRLAELVEYIGKKRLI